MTIEEFAKRSAQRAYLEKECRDADTVSRKLFDQIKWERDLAIQQLKELGYGLGEVIKPQELSNNSPKLDSDSGELISKQAAIKTLHDEIVRRRISEDTNDDGALDEFDTEAILRKLPSTQPDRKTGWWLIREGISDAQCSECGMYFNDVYDMENSDAFCRHCGTKMEGLKVVKNE